MSPLPHDLVDVVLVAWSGSSPDSWSQLKRSLNDALRLIFTRGSSRNTESREDPFAAFARQLTPDTENLRVLYAGKNPSIVEEEVEQAIRKGASEIIVMPLVFALEEGHPEEPSAQDLIPGIERIEARHPQVKIFFTGPPFGRVHRLERLINKIRQKEPEGAHLLDGFIIRGFDGDWSRFARFMAVLHEGIPPETRVAVRGSALTGYRHGSDQPFDAFGDRSSDLDLVLVGDEVMERWSDDGFYVPGILTMPLDDAHAHFAPWLNETRRELEAIANRPVHIQAMTQWFLDLRVALLNTEYLLLDA